MYQPTIWVICQNCASQMDTIEVVSYLVYLAQDWLKATLFEMSEKLLNSTKCETTLPQTSMIFQNAIKKVANNCK
jgi:hypothetical protein